MNFYYVQSDDKYAFAKYIDGGEKNYICESCKRVYQIDRISDFQVQFIGKKQADFYRSPGCYIGNRKFTDMLAKYEIKGYRLRDIDFKGWVDKRNNPVDNDASDLQEIEIMGRCGKMCYLNGDVIPGCEECGLVNFFKLGRVQGVSVDESAWDGSDIFAFDNKPAVMICSERLKVACENEKIKGIFFIPLQKYLMY